MWPWSLAVIVVTVLPCAGTVVTVRSDAIDYVVIHNIITNALIKWQIYFIFGLKF